MKTPGSKRTLTPKLGKRSGRESVQESQTTKSGARWLQWGERLSLVLAVAAVVVIFGALRPSEFLTVSNFSSIFASQAVLVVLTCGLLLPLTAGDYDLSIAATLLLSQMVIALMTSNHTAALPVAIVLALALGLAIGTVNALFTIVVGIDSLIVTLGTGTVVSGIVLLISNSEIISGVSPHLVAAVSGDSFAGVPLEFYYAVGVVAILWYVLEYTVFGRRLLFVGRGREVARLNGVRVGRVRWVAFMGAGVLSAAAGALYLGTVGSADPTAALSYLLPAWAAAFLGTTAIVPGRFNPWGSFIAVLFLASGISGLALLGVQSWIQDVFYGAALVVAVSLSQLFRLRGGGAT